MDETNDGQWRTLFVKQHRGSLGEFDTIQAPEKPCLPREGFTRVENLALPRIGSQASSQRGCAVLDIQAVIHLDR